MVFLAEPSNSTVIISDKPTSPTNVKDCQALSRPLTIPPGVASYRCETKSNHYRNPGDPDRGGHRRILAGLCAGRLLSAQLPAEFRGFEEGRIHEPGRAFRLQPGLVQLEDPPRSRQFLPPPRRPHVITQNRSRPGGYPGRGSNPSW